MNSNPFENNEFKHYLRFNNYNTIWYEIIEPIGFDALRFTIQQNAGRYSRDVEYSIDKLKFVDVQSAIQTTEQVVDVLGNQSSHLDMGLNWLLSARKEFGFEASVDYKCTKDGVDFRSYELDFTDKKLTDGKYYLECKLIDNGKVANVKRTFDSKMNALDVKNWIGDAITPMPTFNYLRKPTAIEQESQLTQPNFFSVSKSFYGLDAYIYNPCLQINTYGVNNTLTSFEEIEYIPDTSNSSDVRNKINNKAIIKAKKRIVNLKVKISGLTGDIIRSGFDVDTNIVVAYGNTPVLDWTRIELFDSTDININFVNQSYEVAIPVLEIGQKVWFFFGSTSLNPLPAGTPISNLGIYIENTLKIDITAVEIGLPIVMKASRYIDLLKQASKFNQNIPIDASLYDAGGIHYDNAVFSKSMVTYENPALYTTPKKVFESVFELNNDFEIKEDVIFVNHQKEYYKDVEIGAFLTNPSSEYSEEFNQRHEINKMVYGWNKYEQDRSTKGTKSSVHTSMELRILNLKVENSKEQKNDFTRDPMAIQKMIDLEISQPTTSTAEDNDIHVEQITYLPPDSTNVLNAFLAQRVISGQLEILNIDSNGESGDSSFFWTSLGIIVGSSVEILLGLNIGNYIVTAVDKNKITLNSWLTPPFSGDGFVSMRYTYLGVNYTTRTKEGFSLIQNISDTFGNLAYTPKRNVINYFSEYLGGCLMFSKKDIVVAEFINNGKCTTQLTGGDVLREDDPILYAGLKNPLINADLISTKVVASFQSVVDMLQQTERGYIRVYDLENDRVIKGYSQKMEYNPIFEELDLILECKFDPERLDIECSDFDWYQTKNDYIRFYDSNNVPLHNYYKYNFVFLNGINYNSIVELVNALETLCL